jgi:hypothetical protein
VLEWLLSIKRQASITGPFCEWLERWNLLEWLDLATVPRREGVVGKQISVERREKKSVEVEGSQR